MVESKIQSKLIKRLESQGWFVIKLIKTNKNGIPDIVCFKDNDFQFIEVKREGGKLSELQKYRIKELNNLGFKTSVHYG